MTGWKDSEDEKKNERKENLKKMNDCSWGNTMK